MINILDINFMNMVDEAYELLNVNNVKSNIILPKMNIETGTTRIHWKNINEYLNIINRDSEHFLYFLKNELCNKSLNWYSNNINDGLIIHDRHIKIKRLTELVKKYITTYVTCASCKNINTILNKISTKKYEFNCMNCYMNKYILF